MIRPFLSNTKFLLPLLLFICSCAPTMPALTTAIPETPEEILRAKEIWQKFEERNRTIEDDPEWIKDSYKEIKIKSLANIPIEKYVNYKKFLDDGKVYIINHASFYAFFHHPKIIRKDNSMTKNIMDIFLQEDNTSGESPSEEGRASHHNKKVRAMKEFERIGRNFLEFKSTEQKLIILILPGNYKKYSNYRYNDGLDEYARFINEVTNMSESVLYLESKKPNRGQLIDEDLNTLIEFLQKIGTTSILLGGEYVGRCQEDLYKLLLEAVGTTMTLEIVPELSPVSPDDMNTDMEDLLDSDNKLDIQAATYNILKDTYQKLAFTPKIRNLTSRMSYEKPIGK